jgi:hypothetical protein
MIRTSFTHGIAGLSLALLACAQDGDQPPTQEEQPSSESDAESARDGGRDAGSDGGRDGALPARDGASGRDGARDAGSRAAERERDGEAGGPKESCLVTQVHCDDRCVDVQSSSAHCGACGTACGDGESCRDGACVATDCSDSCPFGGGVDWQCKLRFMYGYNYAWHHFGGDFGGNQKWTQPGVSANPKVEEELSDLSKGGVSVLRWWMFPDFRGDGVSFDASDTPSGLGGTFEADLERALALAEDYDLHLMLTLFSFDNFRPTKMDNGILSRGLKPVLSDVNKRRALVDKVVRPIARAVAMSRNAGRVIAWDVINEPEWAISGKSEYGDDPDFDPNPELEAISHLEMETFLKEVVAALREESEALITVGGTAMKWRHAWSKLDLDFHQFHTYDWVNMYWPYDRSPADYGVDDKPVVMGEFPGRGLTGVPYATMLDSWYAKGYAGALGWAYTDKEFGGREALVEVKRFADRHPCETKY